MFITSMPLEKLSVFFFIKTFPMLTRLDLTLFRCIPARNYRLYKNGNFCKGTLAKLLQELKSTIQYNKKGPLVFLACL